MSAESTPTHCDIDKQGTPSTDDKYSTEKPDNKKKGSDSTRPPAPNAPKIEVLEVGTSDTEEEIDQLQLTRTTTPTKVDSDATQDKGERDAATDHEDNRLSANKVEIHSAPQNSPPRLSSSLPAPSVTQHPSYIVQDTNGASTRRLPQPPQRPESRSSMHSLFSDSLEEERTVSSYPPILPAGRIEVKVQEKATPVRIPSHDSKAWKEPSFLTRNKGKGKAHAAKDPDVPSAKMGKKRLQSTQPESPIPKRAKVATPEARRMTSGQTTVEIMQHQDIEASVIGTNSSNRRSTSIEMMTPSTAFQLSKPRLVNLVVDFEGINLGKKVPMPMVDMDNNVKGILVRTGRIRTLGKEVVQDGRVYLMS